MTSVAAASRRSTPGSARPSALPLFDLLATAAEPQSEGWRRYREWRRTDAGRQVFALFERFALELAQGRRRFGFKAVAERVRWEIQSQWRSADFKVNNSYVALIAREIAALHPVVKELVEFRAAKVDEGSTPLRRPGLPAR